MKVLQLINTYSPVFGCGPADRCQKMASYLASRGHTVTIFTSNYSLDPEFVGLTPAVEVVPFPSLGGRFCYTPAMAPATLSRIYEFDVVHLMNHWTYQNILGYKAARKAGIPYVFSAMGALPIVYRSFMLKRIYNLLYGRRIINNAAALLGITKRECRQYQAHNIPPSRIHFLPNAIDETEYSVNVESGRFRKEFGIRHDRKLILFLGRLSHIKGPDILLEGFIRGRDKLTDTILAFVGPDFGMEEDLKRTVAEAGISESVFFCGPLTGQAKIEAYSDADVFVVPSRQENMSIVAVEACALGIPVVITNTCDFDDIENKGAGKVVPVDPQQIIQAVLHILMNEPVRTDMSEKAVEMVREYYTWERLGERLESILLKLVDRKKGPRTT